MQPFKTEQASVRQRWSWPYPTPECWCCPCSTAYLCRSMCIWRSIKMCVDAYDSYESIWHYIHREFIERCWPIWAFVGATWWCCAVWKAMLVSHQSFEPFVTFSRRQRTDWPMLTLWGPMLGQCWAPWRFVELIFFVRQTKKHRSTDKDARHASFNFQRWCVWGVHLMDMIHL